MLLHITIINIYIYMYIFIYIYINYSYISYIIQYFFIYYFPLFPVFGTEFTAGPDSLTWLARQEAESLTAVTACAAGVLCGKIGMEHDLTRDYENLEKLRWHRWNRWFDETNLKAESAFWIQQRTIFHKIHEDLISTTWEIWALGFEKHKKRRTSEANLC